MSHGTTPDRRQYWRRVVTWSAIAVLVAPLLWLGGRSFVAYDALMNAQARISDARNELLSIGPSPLPLLLREVADDTGLARAMMSDPVWSAAEGVPLVGPNMRVVREVTQVLDDFVAEGTAGIRDNADSLSFDLARPRDGAFEIERIQSLVPVVDDAIGQLRHTAAELDRIDLTGALGPVRSAVQSVRAQMDALMTYASSAEDALELVPQLLGSAQARSYLIVVLDSTVDRALGGAPVVGVIANVDEGEILFDDPIRLAEALSDESFELLDDAAHSPSVPAFGELTTELLGAELDLDVSTVILIDTVALTKLVSISGDVTVSGAGSLDAAGAYDRLVLDASQSTQRRAELISDAAAAVLEQVAEGHGATRRFADVAVTLMNESRVSIWASREEEQELFASTPFARTLPPDNSRVLSYGGYLNQLDPGAAATSLTASVRLWGPTCTPTDRTLARATWSLESDGSSSYGVTAFAPVGAKVEAIYLDDHPLEFDQEATVDGRDLFTAQFDLQQGAQTLEIHYRLPEADRNPMQFRTNPRWQVTQLDLRAC